MRGSCSHRQVSRDGTAVVLSSRSVSLNSSRAVCSFIVDRSRPGFTGAIKLEIPRAVYACRCILNIDAVH